MRFIEEIILKGFKIPHLVPGPWESKASLFEQIKSSTVFRVDNVCDYIAKTLTPQEPFERTFPCLRPSFTSMWFEWTNKDFAHYGNAADKVTKVGVLALSASGFEGAEMASKAATPYHQDCVAVTLLIVMEIFGNRAFMGTYGFMQVDNAGKMRDGFVTFGATDIEFNEMAVTFFAVPMMTMCFLNCKNVAVVDSSPSAALQKAFIRRHGRPMLKFKTLEIEPMKRVLSSEGKIETNGLKKALHICRGHFATYDEKPLFGKVKGTFWVPQHVKGSATQGTIVKDYSVKAPAVKSA